MDKKSYCLSSGDIYKFFDGKVKIVTFKEIANYETLEKLLHPYNKVVILFESKPNNGHWTCLFKNSEGEIYFFDSYGMKPESELRYSAGMNKYLNQRRNTLLRLFDNHLVKYSDYQLQKWKKGTNTCGRYVIARMCCDHLNSHEFAELLRSQTNDVDQFITDITNKFIAH